MVYFYANIVCALLNIVYTLDPVIDGTEYVNISVATLNTAVAYLFLEEA